MRLLERLRAICKPMPPGSAVTLPVDWIMGELGSHESGQPRQEPRADLTVEEVASIVGRQPGTVREWIRNGLNGVKLTAYWFSSREYRITRAALEAFLEEQRQRAGGGAERRFGEPEIDLRRWRRKSPPARP